MSEFLAYCVFILLGICIGTFIGWGFAWKFGRYAKEGKWPRDDT